MMSASGIPDGAAPPVCVLKMPIDRRCLREILRCMSAVAGMCRPDLALLDDRGMEMLQAACLGRPGPTNILAFPVPATGPEGLAGGFCGCLALSADSLEREAVLYGQDPAAYCIRLLAHGLAHLAGYDHSPAMRELEERLERTGAAAWSVLPIYK
jgi:probable rRNA maturation factor